MWLYLTVPSSLLTQNNLTFYSTNTILKLIVTGNPRFNSDRNTYLDFELYFSKTLSVLIQFLISDS